MLSDKVAIITGCNKGIGYATLKVFAQNHANVWACARTKSEDFEKRISDIEREYKTSVSPVYFDVADFDAAKKAIKEIGKKSGKVDILVNNAGISVEKLFQMTSVDVLRGTMDINFISQVNLAQLASRYMMKQGHGAIVNVASVAGMSCEEGGIAYGSSKAAVLFSTQTMALELGRYGIRVNAVSPGFIDTDMWRKRKEELKEIIQGETALGRQGMPEEVANTILFLASDMSSYISGQNIVVDGGRKMGGGNLANFISYSQLFKVAEMIRGDNYND